MDVRLMGSLHLTADDGTAIEVTGQKMRALFTRLAIDNGGFVTVDRLIEDLWGADPPANAGNSLQSLVSKLRRAIGRNDLIVNNGNGYRLDLPSSALDIGRFETLVNDARADVASGRLHSARSGFDAALRLWRDPPLAELQYDDFAQRTIARLNELHVSAREERIEIALECGEESSVIAELHRLIAEHPLRERLRGQLMRALYRCGRQAEALRAYEAARTTLADELGLDPSPALKALQAAILNHDPSLGAAGTAQVTTRPRARPGNIPIPLTEIVGRARDIAAVGELFDRHRLVTLLGPGGAGKTRLALEVARAGRVSAADGAFMVDLAPIQQPGGVGRAIATALGFESPDDVVQGLRRHLVDRDVLLLFDNCEHVLSAAAHAAADLLSSCPGVRVLATSREALGVPGEVVWPTPPLSQGEASELFMQRATAIAPGFRPDAREFALVSEVCARLDGMPLAVELAAARIRSMSVGEIAARLDDRFRLLSSGSRTALPRQQTLRAVVDWSYDMLSAEERTLFDRMSIFVGSCAAADAAAVCATDELPPEDIADCLARLVDKSLVTAEHATTPTRYRMLQTLALYGREHLDTSATLDELRSRHTAHFVALAAQSEPALHGVRQLEWVGEVRCALDDLRAAFAAAHAGGDATSAMTIAGGLGWFWWVDGGVVEGSDLLETALALPGPCDEAARVLALTWAAYLSMHAGRGARSAQLTIDALDAARAFGEPVQLGSTCMLLATRAIAGGDMSGAADLFDEAAAAFGSVADNQWSLAAFTFVRAEGHHLRGDHEQAARMLADAASRLEGAGDEVSRAMCDRIAADLAHARNDHDAAMELLARARATAERYGFEAFASMVGTRFATVALATGDLGHARMLLDEAEQRGRRLDYSALLAWALSLSSVLLRHDDRLDEARAAAIEALALYRATPVPTGLLTSLHTLGRVAERCGDADGAYRHHAEELAEARRVGDARATASALEGLAAAVLLDGDALRAAQLLAEAAHIRDTAGCPPTVIDTRDIQRITLALATHDSPSSPADQDTAVPNRAPMP